MGWQGHAIQGLAIHGPTWRGPAWRGPAGDSVAYRKEVCRTDTRELGARGAAGQIGRGTDLSRFTGRKCPAPPLLSTSNGSILTKKGGEKLNNTMRFRS